MKSNRILICVHATGWMSIYIFSFRRIVQLHAQFAWRMDVRGCLPGAGSWSWRCCRHFTSAKPAIGGSPLAKRARGASCNFEEGQNFYDSPQLQLACHSWARKWRKWRRQLKSLKLKPLHHQLRRNHPCRAPNAATSSNSFFLLRKRLYWSFVEWFWSWVHLESWIHLRGHSKKLTDST